MLGTNCASIGAAQGRLHASVVTRASFLFCPNCNSGNTNTTRHDFPLPDPPASVEATGGFNYPNSNGFQFEAEAVHKCIREGKTYSDQYTPNEMLAVMHVLDECRKQLNVERVVRK